MNHKVPISSPVFERLELSVQVSRSNGLSYPFKKHCQSLERFELSRKKKICQPFQLSVGKNKTVTSSFQWKVKCCEWSLCGDVFISFRKYCRGISQLRSTQQSVHSCENLSSHWVFMAVDCDRITSRLTYEDKIFCTTLFTETPLR